jgi:hypothetical protein
MGFGLVAIRREGASTTIFNELLMFTCVAAIVTWIVLAAASILI